MENAVRQRIKEILKNKNQTVNSFSGGDSALQLRLSRQLNKNVSISLDTILIILDRFPDLSAEWLLRGKGEMFDEDNMKSAFGDFMTDLQEIHVKYSMLQNMYDEKCAELAELRKKQ